MGGIAGAAGGARLTRWCFAVETVPPLGDEPVALVGRSSTAAEGRPARQTVAARRALRRDVLTLLAGRALDVPESGIALGVRSDGVRLVERDDPVRGRETLFASVAHRSGWVAAVVARVPVGIDLEHIAEAACAGDVVLADATVDDLAAWHGLAGVWAAREAVLKAQGRDLTRDPGGWRFTGVYATANGIAAHRVDLARRPEIVVAVAYARG